MRLSLLPLLLGAVLLAGCGSEKISTPAPPAAPKRPVAKFPVAAGGTVRVSLDSTLVAALDVLDLRLRGAGTSSISDALVLTLPVDDGNVELYPVGEPPFVLGQLDLAGARLVISGERGRVTIDRMVFALGDSVVRARVRSTKSGTQTVPVFALDQRSLKPLKLNATRTYAVLDGGATIITEQLATVINKTTGVTAFTQGLAFGATKITVPTGG